MWGSGRARSALPLLLAVAAGCAAHVAPMTDAGSDYATAEDESALLARATLVVADVDAHGGELGDPAVAAYVARVGGALAPPTLPPHFAFHYHVLRSADVNAFALPEGDIYVPVGLLVQLDNEAQIAQVLAHEMTHVIKRHALGALRSRRRKAVAAQVATMATLGIAAPFATIPYRTTLTSYERDQEEDADTTGLEMVRRAGYDASAAASLYDTLANVVPPRQQGGESIYSTHPSLLARSAYMRVLVADATNGGGRVDADTYRAAIDPLAPEYVRLLLQGKQFAAAKRYTDGVLARQPDAAWARCANAAAHLGAADDPEFAAREDAIQAGQRALADDQIAAAAAAADAEREQARKGFRRCLELDPTARAPHRALGLLAHAAGDGAAAQAELSRYLALAPDASDRRYIESLSAPTGRTPECGGSLPGRS